MSGLSDALLRETIAFHRKQAAEFEREVNELMAGTATWGSGRLITGPQRTRQITGNSRAAATHAAIANAIEKLLANGG